MMSETFKSTDSVSKVVRNYVDALRIFSDRSSNSFPKPVI